MAAAAGVIDEEVRRFAALGDEWWNPIGPMAALHRLNPTRLAWMRDTIAAHFGRDVRGAAPPLAGLRVLDVGCGGGLVAEPLARMGAEVTGLDPAAESIAVARAHAEATGAQLAYRAGLVEELVAEGARFDVVTALEVVEHVADLRAFVAAAATLAKPGGLVLAATLNRTLKSFALAIVGAEYVLGWVAKGTHRWEQFVTPAELAAALEAAGCRETARRGIVYDLPRCDWRLSSDVSVNYVMAARKL
jgi:2-polyprenyl-6-hydroxyphenyl methylase/3-demethylubiquinone-9 3-methyltransferase